MNRGSRQSVIGAFWQPDAAPVHRSDRLPTPHAAITKMASKAASLLFAKFEPIFG
jgi:hypothetical protein